MTCHPKKPLFFALLIPMFGVIILFKPESSFMILILKITFGQESCMPLSMERDKTYPFIRASWRRLMAKSNPALSADRTILTSFSKLFPFLKMSSHVVPLEEKLS